MGDKAMCRNLLFELWNQVEKYRKHGDTLEFDFHFGATNFKDWYRDHKVATTLPLLKIIPSFIQQTFGLLGDYYCSWNNLVFASEMYRMAIERILKCILSLPFSLSPLPPSLSRLNGNAVNTWADLFKIDLEAWDKFEIEDQDEALRYLIARSSVPLYFFSLLSLLKSGISLELRVTSRGNHDPGGSMLLADQLFSLSVALSLLSRRNLTMCC
jgi:hypothetical protein